MVIAVIAIVAQLITSATATAQQTVILILRIRKEAATATQAVITRLVIIVMANRTAAAQAQQLIIVNVVRVDKVAHELNELGLQLLGRKNFNVLLSLRLREHTHNACTARRTTAPAAAAQDQVNEREAHATYHVVN